MILNNTPHYSGCSLWAAGRIYLALEREVLSISVERSHKDQLTVLGYATLPDNSEEEFFESEQDVSEESALYEEEQAAVEEPAQPEEEQLAEEPTVQPELKQTVEEAAAQPE